MRTIDEYFTRVRQAFQSIADIHVERYDEQVLSVTRGNLRVRLRFSDQSLLEISEAIMLVGEEPRWPALDYDPVCAGFVAAQCQHSRGVEDAATFRRHFLFFGLAAGFLTAALPVLFCRSRERPLGDRLVQG